jgi:hypothetical protein
VSVTFLGRPNETFDLVDGYKRFDPITGAVVESRANLTDSEIARVNEWLAGPNRVVTRETLLAQVRAARATNLAFLALPAPTYPLGVAAQTALVNQVTALTRQVDGLIRLIVGSDLLDQVDP